MSDTRYLVEQNLHLFIICCTSPVTHLTSLGYSGQSWCVSGSQDAFKGYCYSDLLVKYSEKGFCHSIIVST